MYLKVRHYISIVISIGFGVTAFLSQAHSETLQDALISAYQTNPSLMAERARVREFDENYVQAQSQGRLTSSLTGSYSWSHIKSPGSGPFGPTGTTNFSNGTPESYQVQVIQPLYQGGRVKALKAQAKAGILAARQGLRNAEQSIFLSTASAYSDVISAEETAKIRRNNVRVLAQQRAAAQTRFDVGEGTRTDIAQADTRLAAAEIGLAQADAQLQIARASYNRATGHLPVELQPVPMFVLPRDVTEAVRIGRQNNPQLIAAIFNEDAAEAGIDAAKSARRPSLSLNATAQDVRQQISGLSKAQTGTIAAQISFPITTGGLNSSRVRAAKAAYSRARFETRDIERAVNQAVSQSWAQMQAAQQSVAASRKQVEAAEFAFEGVKLEQQVGTRSSLDVLNAEQELLEAKLSVVSSQNIYETTVFELLSIIGAFDAESLRLPIDRYDPEENFNKVTDDWFLNDAVDNYVPEAVEKIAKQVPDIVEDVGEFAIDAVEETKIPKVTGKIAKQIPEVPHDILVGAKKAIDNPIALPRNMLEISDKVVTETVDTIAQTPNIPDDIAVAVKKVIGEMTNEVPEEPVENDQQVEDQK